MNIRNATMFLFYFSVGLAVLSNLVYHVTQKLTPSDANPALALIVTYVVSLLVCVGLLGFMPLGEPLPVALGRLNWASVGLGVGLVGLEMGFLLAYRAGWNMSTAAIVVNVIVALLLIPIGLALFKEHLSLVNLLGIGVCIIGLVLVNWR